LRNADIQNPGVDRMSGMSSILGIPPHRPRLLAQRAEMKGEQLSGMVASRAAVPPFHFGSW